MKRKKKRGGRFLIRQEFWACGEGKRRDLTVGKRKNSSNYYFGEEDEEKI